MQTLETRVQKLELSARRWRWGCAIIALLAICLLSVAADERQPDVIHAKKIVLDTEDGLRIELGSSGKGASGLRIIKDRDHILLAAGASPDTGAAIICMNKKGNTEFVYPRFP